MVPVKDISAESLSYKDIGSAGSNFPLNGKSVAGIQYSTHA